MNGIVLPSRSESLPRSVLETLALQKTVVTANVGTRVENAEDGRVWTRRASENLSAVADKIVLLHSDCARARVSGGARRKGVEQTFTLKQVVQEY